MILNPHLGHSHMLFGLTISLNLVACKASGCRPHVTSTTHLQIHSQASSQDHTAGPKAPIMMLAPKVKDPSLASNWPHGHAVCSVIQIAPERSASFDNSCRAARSSGCLVIPKRIAPPYEGCLPISFPLQLCNANPEHLVERKMTQVTLNRDI